MGIVVIILFVLVAVITAVLSYKHLKWMFRKKQRLVAVFMLLTFVAVSYTIHKLFFVRMEFVQSKAYPDLYLVKNPVEDQKMVYKAIKEKVILEKANASQEKPLSNLRFYEYYKGDMLEHGTAYFLKHKEKRDGMMSELFDFYPNYLLASFHIQACKEDTTQVFGRLDYYKDRKPIKTDTLFNSCKK